MIWPLVCCVIVGVSGAFWLGWTIRGAHELRRQRELAQTIDRYVKRERGPGGRFLKGDGQCSQHS